jgi:hypothetical protein
VTGDASLCQHAAHAGCQREAVQSRHEEPRQAHRGHQHGVICRRRLAGASHTLSSTRLRVPGLSSQHKCRRLLPPPLAFAAYDALAALTAVHFQAACAGVRAARGTLRAAADDVQRNISVVTQTRRKQGYLTLMEVCLKLQKAKNLQQSLK